MIGVLQRVREAVVWVSSHEISRIGSGILLLVGIAIDDTERDIEYIVQKTIHLRIFGDASGNLNLSLLDIEGELLVVSQFTLLGNTRKGRRPSFSNAMHPEQAKLMYDRLISRFKQQPIKVREGIFGAIMEVHLVNDGPVTLIINSRDTRQSRNKTQS